MAAGATNAQGRTRTARIPGPPASVTDALFRSAVNGGIGLTKLEFYSPRNGFRLFPTNPVRFSGRGGGNRPDWTSLNQFPRGRSEVIACDEMPDPPGNAGWGASDRLSRAAPSRRAAHDEERARIAGRPHKEDQS